MLVRATIEGLRPLIMHNGQGADPLNKYALELKKKTSQKKKTEVDLREIAAIEFESCLYWSDELGGVYIPTENLQSMLHKGATKFKLGRQIIAALVDDAIGAPLITPNWNKKAKLLDNTKDDNPAHFRTLVVQNMSRIAKTRPRFAAGWTLAFHIDIDESIITEEDVRMVLDMCGKMVGLGDWRPSAPKSPGTFGRFQVTGWEVVE